LLLLGPLQQFHSFVKRHYPAPGKLMGRSDGHDPSGCLQQTGNIYPLVCFRCGQDSKTLSLERTGNQRIARVFYSYSRGNPLKKDGQIMEKQMLLRANDNLLLAAHDTANPEQVSGKLLAQSSLAL